MPIQLAQQCAQPPVYVRTYVRERAVLDVVRGPKQHAYTRSVLGGAEDGLPGPCYASDVSRPGVMCSHAERAASVERRLLRGGCRCMRVRGDFCVPAAKTSMKPLELGWNVRREMYCRIPRTFVDLGPLVHFGC